MRAAPQRLPGAVRHGFIGQCVALAGGPGACVPAVAQQRVVFARVATQVGIITIQANIENNMTTPRTWHIYTLTDPRTDAIRYVGWSFDVARRLSAHVSTAKNTVSHKSHWVRSLTSLGLRPIATVIESGTGDWQEAERRWIAHHIAIGAKLTNMTIGGDGTPGLIPSQETRDKMSKAGIGRKRSPESIAKSRAGLLGKKQSQEHIAALSKVRKGSNPIAATTAAALVNKGRKQTPEFIAKRIAPLIGRVRPDDRSLTAEQVRFIRATNGAISLRKIAAQMGVGQTIIFEIRHRTAYQDIVD